MYSRVPRLVLVALLCLGCGTGLDAGLAVAGGGGAVANLRINVASVLIGVGESAVLSVTASDAAGAALPSPPVAWRTDNPAVVSVGGSGAVTGISAGSATITATAGGIEATVPVSVTGTPVPVASLTILPATASVEAGSTVQLNAIARDAAGRELGGRAATWSSATPSVATVNASGLVTGVSAGSAVVTGTAAGVSATATITVTQTPLATFSVSPTTVTMVANTLQPLAFTMVDRRGQSATSRPITWTSTNSQVAVVDAQGRVDAGVEVGTATLTGTIEGLSVTITVTTTPRVTLSGAAFKADTFGHYSAIGDLFAVTGRLPTGLLDPTKLYTEISNRELLAIDQTVRYNGHATLRYNQPGGSALTPRPEVWWPVALPSVWFRAKLRFSRGFTTKGTLTASDDAFKMILWGWSNRSSGRGGLNVVNTDIYLLDWNDPGSATSYAYQRGGRVASEWTDERWYDFIIFYETVPGGARMRVWIAPDGDPPQKRIDFVAATSTADPPTVNRVTWGSIMNQVRAASQSQAYWFGQWEIVNPATSANPFNLDLAAP